MSKDMVLTVIARDRPGLIKALSEVVVGHGGNWIDSSMARLGGEFAGIVRGSVPEERSREFETALADLSGAGITVTLRRSDEDGSVRAGRLVRLELTGVDHPGIVHRISDALSTLGISIDQLETRIFTGSMSGEPMFEAKAEIHLPEGVEEAKLRSRLEALERDLMVDIELDGV